MRGGNRGPADVIIDFTERDKEIFIHAKALCVQGVFYEVFSDQRVWKRISTTPHRECKCRVIGFCKSSALLVRLLMDIVVSVDDLLLHARSLASKMPVFCTQGLSIVLALSSCFWVTNLLFNLLGKKQCCLS